MDFILAIILIAIYYVCEINYTNDNGKYKKEKHKFSFKKVDDKNE